MKTELYKKIEDYMLQCMSDSAHDREHIYRVLFTALDIAKFERNLDIDVLITACLLHDIGRKEQFENPKLCHAQIGSEKAYSFAKNIGFSEEKASQIKACILTHRFRSNNPPKSIEAKILFDADKLDSTGTLGIARTLFYKAQVSEPLYTIDNNGNILDGTNDNDPSFFQEYKYKLEKLYDKFYTKRGAEIAKERQYSAIAFYSSMLKEVQQCCDKGKGELKAVLVN